MNTATAATPFSTPQQSPAKSSLTTPLSHSGHSKHQALRRVNSPLAQQLAAKCSATDQATPGTAQASRKIFSREGNPMSKLFLDPAALATSQLFLNKRVGAKENSQNGVQGQNNAVKAPFNKDEQDLRHKIEVALKNCNRVDNPKIFVRLMQILMPFFKHQEHVYGGSGFTNTLIQDVAALLGMLPEAEIICLDQTVFAYFFDVTQKIFNAEKINMPIEDRFAFATKLYEKLSSNPHPELAQSGTGVINTFLESSIRNEINSLKN